MDSDEYYDSLDEDSNYGSLGSLGDYPSNNNISSERRYISNIPVKSDIQLQKENDTNCCQLDDIIPFYDQSLSKSDVELKYGSGFEEFKRKSRKKFNNKKTLIPNVYGKLKSTSYLDMFRAKIGMDKDDSTNRATCIDLTPKSYTTCLDFEIASLIDLSEIESICTSDNIKNHEESSQSLSSLDSKLYSVSQQNLKLNGVNINKKNVCKPRHIKIPELGRLGPEISKDKLELLKKRQEYGHKVNQKNKIKIIERKLLQNLQKEIKECKNIL